MSEESDKQTLKSPANRAVLIAAVITGGAALIAALIAGGASLGAPLVQRWAEDRSVSPPARNDAESAQPTPEDSGQHSSSGTARATTVSHTEGKGLYTHTQPRTDSSRGSPEHLPEGAVIYVECQERNGDSLSDPEGDPSRYSKPWPVWNRLTNGSWISDLYTDLPKKPGEAPPTGIPKC